MSSDKIKAALIAAFPGTTEAQWKRRSKSKVAGGAQRTFENTTTGQMVSTVEAQDGSVSISGGAAASHPATHTYDPGLAKKITETGRKVLDDLVKTVPEVVKANTDGVIVRPSRNQMVKKSVWVFHADCELVLWIDNEERNKLIQARFPRGGHARDAEIMAMPIMVQKKIATIPAGTRITVLDKMAPAYLPYGADKHMTNGLMVPVQLDDNHAVDFHMPRNTGYTSIVRNPLDYFSYPAEGRDKKLQLVLPFTKIAPCIKAEAIPETIVYVLRDSATGLFFGGWVIDKRTFKGRDGAIYEDSRSTDVPRMVEKFSSAKKYATSSAVKASIREFTGYNSGLNTENYTEGGAYYVQGGDKKMDLPPNWEMVAIDKTTGVEKETIDVQNWHRDAVRLRTLTQNHGPAVRAVFKKAEHVETATTILVFQNRSRGNYTSRGVRRDYDEPETFEDMSDSGKALLDAIWAAAEYISTRPLLRAKTNTSVAYACTRAEAVAVRLAFSYPEDAVLIRSFDKETLTEILEENET